MELIINGCTIKIDESATREYYTAHREHNSCTCSGCENFREYCSSLSEEVRTFFQSCGIDDMRVIREIIPFCMTDDGLLFYGGFYHLVGTIENGQTITYEIPCYVSEKDDKGKTIIKRTDTRMRTHTQSDRIAIDSSFTVFFKDELDLIPDDFPDNAIQIEIEAHLPWVIDKENTY